MERQDKTGGARVSDPRALHRLAAVVLGVAMVGMWPAGAHATIVVDFEDLEVGTRIDEGESFESGGVTVSIPLPSGRGDSNAVVVDTDDTGHALRIEFQAAFDFPEPIVEASFKYGQGAQLGFGPGRPAITYDLEGIADSGTPFLVDDLVIVAAAQQEGLLVGVTTITATTGTFDQMQVGTFSRDATVLIDDLLIVIPEPASGVPLISLGILMLKRGARRHQCLALHKLDQEV